MYNSEIKQKFISQYSNKDSMIDACVRLFEVSGPYEAEANSDLCTMDADTLQPIVNNMLGLRASGHYTTMCALRAYCNWCLENGIEGACDGLLNVKDDNTDKVRRQMVNSPLHLQRYLDALFDREDEKTNDNIYRCFFWLAFGGCSEKDIGGVMDTDVDFENMVVRLDGEREYPIYRESLKAFKNCVSLDGFIYKHPNYAKDVYRFRVEGHELLRGIRSKPDLMSIRSQISHKGRNAVRAGKTDQSLSYFRVWLSGIFYRIYQLELVGIKPDFKELSERFPQENRSRTQKKRTIREYTADYERWKVAFIK